MVNRVVLVGRLARDPELRYTPQGRALARMTIAVDRPRSKDGEKEGADFIDVTAWGRLAETCAEYLTTGRLVSVDGRLRVDSWKDANGKWRKSVGVVAEEVRFLDRGERATEGAEEVDLDPAAVAAAFDGSAGKEDGA